MAADLLQHDQQDGAIPSFIEPAIDLADPSWHAVLRAGIRAVAKAEPEYFAALENDIYLPTGDRLFAAFRQPLDAVRYVLFGEGPYPREESATGMCFMDGAVGGLWSIGGLSKPVNRATSLRNFMKMLLVADGRLLAEKSSGDAMAPIAAEAMHDGSPWISTLAELQDNLMQHGFLLLNASLVFRPSVAPLKDAKAWRPFMQVVLQTLAERTGSVCPPPTLVLWGKIAGYIQSLSIAAQFPQAVSEHPYNLSFIANPGMQALFAPMHLLKRSRTQGNELRQRDGCSGPVP